MDTQNHLLRDGSVLVKTQNNGKKSIYRKKIGECSPAKLRQDIPVDSILGKGYASSIYIETFIPKGDTLFKISELSCTQ